MSQVEDAIARLAQVCGRLGPIRERLLDIEARLAAAKVTDTKQPALISLREFTSNFLAETPRHSPRTPELEEYRVAAHQFAENQVGICTKFPKENPSPRVPTLGIVGG
jgi:hypothetical protein